KKAAPKKAAPKKAAPKKAAPKKPAPKKPAPKKPAAKKPAPKKAPAKKPAAKKPAAKKPAAKKAAPAKKAAAPKKSGVKLSISFEETPNPNAMKFSLGAKVFDKAVSWTAGKDDTALAKALLSIPGVKSVFAVNDFVTVTKDDSAIWGSLTKPVVDALTQNL
ncbi:MAG: hypothetical protein GY913_18485, partial [Proteobacteria bacterium]|nr:hypothetical protein [Pseudomonadota bacterium]